MNRRYCGCSRPRLLDGIHFPSSEGVICTRGKSSWMGFLRAYGWLAFSGLED